MTADPGCGGHDSHDRHDSHDGHDRHAGLAAELRAVAVLALDRLGPALDSMRTSAVPQSAETCAWCPVCAVLAALHGERPELAARLAEQAGGLLDVLRAAMEPGSDPEPDRAPRPTRRVQHIRVERRPVPVAGR